MKSDFIEIDLLSHSVMFRFTSGIEGRRYHEITPSSYRRLMTVLGQRYQRGGLFLSAITPGLLNYRIDRNS